MLPENVTIKIADVAGFPLFSQDLEDEPPTTVREFKDELRKSDAVLFATPEHNHSISALLKNAIEWGETAGQRMGWQSRCNNERFDGAERRGALSNASATDSGRPEYVHDDPSGIICRNGSGRV